MLAGRGRGRPPVGDVGLTDAKAARHREVAAGVHCSETTLWRYRRGCAAGGAAALAPAPKGSQRASKLTPDRVARIRQAREQEVRLQAIADAEGIARSSVIRALADTAGGDPAREAPDGERTTPTPSSASMTTPTR